MLPGPVITAITPDLRIASEPIRIVGMQLSTNMSVLRLRGDALLVHSPIPLTPARRAAVEAMGEVAHLYAPNTFHHLWLEPWSRAFPQAKVHAPSELARVHRVDRAHDREREPDFAGVLHEHPIEGFRMAESALLHVASGALLVADLVHNVGRPPGAWAQAYTRAMGFYDRVALSRMLRWTCFTDRRRARASVDAVLEHPFERLLVGHGAPLLEGGRDALAEAYAWLEGGGEALALPGAPRPCG
ncbi:MAG: hypothetical protein H6740_13285 [Alphaproteobacteria bacterium]|nr:hypothetical protein [Alphaproteobacteria bacterium]